MAALLEGDPLARCIRRKQQARLSVVEFLFDAGTLFVVDVRTKVVEITDSRGLDDLCGSSVE